MSVKLLMFGPGAPGRLTSGLGVATAKLAEELSKKTSLKIIEPKSFDQFGKPKVNLESSFSDLSVLKELATVSIEAQLSAYDYHEVTQSHTMEKVESQKLHKQLTTYSDELVLEGEKIDYDVLYAHDWITFKAALELKERFGKPLLLHIHSLDFDRNFGQTKSWIFDLEQKTMQAADAIIAVSEYSKQVMISEYGISPDKIQVIYHGHTHTDPVKAKSPFAEKIVLFVGRLSGQKGPMQFLEIAEKVFEQNPDTRFVISGEGELYKKLIEAGAGSEIADRFHITGYLEHEELQKLYAIAHVYCMPSFSEPFGLAAVEAADAGVPLVLSDKCGAAELLPDAHQANPASTDDFADQIIAILGDENMSKLQVKSNREKIKKLSWEKSAAEVLSVVDKIL
ncbi:Glycosyltransferase involved in cell wall bisynthesis [Reichenbachiella faecimaris]|uniref:Glycosyltransferase involved in cell wall bisynthesis n=1 Tax=Reichenbachiella faecimaris TaxID=692418 RepID=A0A1W2GAT4_REIFA|nr:glycosyltransferase family 4 protein [Reichenbachiella faecimaris]SMD33733.1 Glycosyltransferase involved in cell wall bisynthesis [Reichenbachiella faecimaris]